MMITKKAAAAVLSAVLIMSLSGCGSKTEEDSSKTETTTAATTTAATAAEETDAADSAAEIEKTEGTYADGVFDCVYYTVTVDQAKWEYKDGTDMDCQFSYIGKPEDDYYSASSFNIASFSQESLEGMTISDYADQIMATYEGVEGYEVTKKDAKLDGNDGVEITINFPMGDSRMTIKQLVAEKNGAVVAVSYGAMDDIYSKMEKQFNKVIDAVKLK